MKDGGSCGAATIVRFGEFDEGSTTTSGGLVYEDEAAVQSSMDASLASMTTEDRFEDWRSVELNTNGPGDAWPSFSHDDNQIAYAAQDADPISLVL